MEISLKFKPFLKPVPKALEKASFAANLLEKKAVLLSAFFDLIISSLEKIRETNFLLVIDFFIRELSWLSYNFFKFFYSVFKTIKYGLSNDKMSNIKFFNFFNFR